MHRIPLSNTEFEGKNNVYLLDNGDRTAIIDTGYATDKIQSQLETGLANYGVAFQDITDIFLTHWHHDHAGMAGLIQQASGATVYAHEADVGLLTQNQTTWQDYESLLRERFADWGMPKAKRIELLDILNLSGRDLGNQLSEVEPLKDGQQFDLGSTTLETMHLPGHTQGLCGFIMEDEQGDEELFSADAILPQYTPNVGGADVRVNHPLQMYLNSLHRIIERGFTKAWPGHREPIDDSAERAAQIISHHNERTERVFEVVRDQGPIDTWSISAELFGSLSAVHIIHGPGEVHAHLDHLLGHGLVKRTDRGYVCPDPDASVESAFSPVCI